MITDPMGAEIRPQITDRLFVQLIAARNMQRWDMVDLFLCACVRLLTDRDILEVSPVSNRIGNSGFLVGARIGASILIYLLFFL